MAPWRKVYDIFFLLVCSGVIAFTALWNQYSGQLSTVKLHRVEVHHEEAIKKSDLDIEEQIQVNSRQVHKLRELSAKLGRIIVAEEGGIFWSQDDVRRGYHQAPQEKAQIYPSLNVSRMMPQHDPVVNHSHESNLLLYNRVPKCASSTMQVVLSTLMEANNFFYDASTVYEVKAWSMAEEKSFVDSFYSRAEPNGAAARAHDRHFYFVDFGHYGILDESSLPNWINVVRQPVERFISAFHYVRKTSRWPKERERPPKAWFDKDLSSCVLGGDAECQFNPDFAVSVEQQLTYFCGSAPQCLRVGERTALAVAKANLERHYATVGLAEDLPTSFRVMEQLLPRFFAGASRIFARMERSDGQQYRRNEGDHKDYYVSNEALAVLRANMSLELEFYEFSRQRLVQQLTNLGL